MDFWWMGIVIGLLIKDESMFMYICYLFFVEWMNEKVIGRIWKLWSLEVIRILEF